MVDDPFAHLTDDDWAAMQREHQQFVDEWWMEASSSDVMRDAEQEAYYMVGYALDAQLNGTEWDPHHLVLSDGRRIEVAVDVALLNRTRPRFAVRRHDPTRAPLDEGVPRPEPDGYVLAFATTQEPRLFGGGPWPRRKEDVLVSSTWAEWELWVLPAAVRAAHPKHKIRVAELEELVGPPVSWTQLADAVDAVVPPRST